MSETSDGYTEINGLSHLEPNYSGFLAALPPRHFLHDNNAFSHSPYTVTTSLPIRAARPPSTPPQHAFLNCFTSAFTIGIYLATSSSCTQGLQRFDSNWWIWVNMTEHISRLAVIAYMEYKERTRRPIIDDDPSSTTHHRRRSTSTRLRKGLSSSGDDLRQHRSRTQAISDSCLCRFIIWIIVLLYKILGIFF
ncbi:hypothetical protein ACFX2I_025665 [Malus domestica]